jgi:hypothetical protein
MTTGTGNDWMDHVRQLLDAVRGSAGGSGAADSGAADSGAAAAGPADGHDPGCRWCPICQVAGVLRGERPELTAALADVLTATATALRSFARDLAEDHAGEGTAGAAGEQTQGEEPSPVVQRIEIA